MIFNRKAAKDPVSIARKLAGDAAELAKNGRRRESEALFRKAFEKVREVKGPLGNLKNDVGERSKLSTVLADQAFCSGLSATFAVEMWKLGCKSDVLDEDSKGATQMFYPLEIMDAAAREREAARADDAPPAVSCEAEKENGGNLSKTLRWLSGALRRLRDLLG
ncbi:MAG: hypothetical protein NTY83_02465 [Candidatus Micrarchaeota archaeon]|nr:hypothetical protein [Candidatus Micrarchaeota archaeon]